MAISKKILDLAHLALSDRVLTYTERQTIAKAAMEEGTPEVEINAVLDNMLTQRLKSFTKEELRNCPHCGAQIPLISDTCLFCGGSLQNTDTATVPPTPTITGAEAEIIQHENIATAAEHRNIKHCPDCGAPFPLVSNICTQCGHVLHEQQDSELNVKNLIANIQQSIDELRQTPQPTFGEVLSYRKHIFTFLVSLLLLAFSIHLIRIGFADSDTKAFLWVPGLSLAFLLWAIISAFLQNKHTPPATVADNKFFAALHRKEMYANQIATLYGNNDEAKAALYKLTLLTDSIKRKRDKRMRSLAITISLSVVGMLILIAYILYVPGEDFFTYVH